MHGTITTLFKNVELKLYKNDTSSEAFNMEKSNKKIIFTKESDNNNIKVRYSYVGM